MNTFIIEDAIDQLKIIDLKHDKSNYINQYGGLVPRVTDILSKTINEPGLIQWANSLGFKHKSYTKELQAAADIGTAAHNSIELFLKSGEETDIVPFKAFKYWWDDIHKNNTIEILGLEEHLVCDYFGGTYDGLFKINDKVVLVDYKTSNHITYRYTLQLAAYRYMLYYTKNISLDGMIILQLGKSEPTYNELYVDLTNQEQYLYIEDCTRAFLSLVYSYYNVEMIKKKYSKLY